METTFIYALKDPNTSEIRYIGKADDPVKRFGQHQKWAERGSQYHVHRWIRCCNGVPIVEILAEVPKFCWEWFERISILDARESGISLTNMADGGDGGSPKGRRASKERRMKLSEALKGNSYAKGKFHAPGTTRGAGKILSAEHRRKLSLALLGNTRTKGRKLSPEHREKVVRTLRPGRNY